MRCSNPLCGKEITDSSQYCKYCGTKISHRQITALEKPDDNELDPVDDSDDENLVKKNKDTKETDLEKYITVVDSLPHGSFFHATGGAVNMNISERMKLIAFEAIVGLTSTIVAVLMFVLV